jgi:hypothetical protein
MHRLARFLRLSIPEKVSLLQATLLLAGVRLGLSFFPFATMRDLLAGLGASRNGHARQAADHVVERTIWAVETAGRQFPTIGTCLYRALAAHVLLARGGCRSNLCIGVKRDARGKFIGHAWLEHDGKILIGGEHQATYIAMPPLNGLNSDAESASQSDVAVRHQSRMTPTRLH